VLGVKGRIASLRDRDICRKIVDVVELLSEALEPSPEGFATVLRLAVLVASNQPCPFLALKPDEAGACVVVVIELRGCDLIPEAVRTTEFVDLLNIDLKCGPIWSPESDGRLDVNSDAQQTKETGLGRIRLPHRCPACSLGLRGRIVGGRAAGQNRLNKSAGLHPYLVFHAGGQGVDDRGKPVGLLHGVGYVRPCPIPPCCPTTRQC
jgi:hypothetical protein